MSDLINLEDFVSAVRNNLQSFTNKICYIKHSFSLLCRQS